MPAIPDNLPSLIIGAVIAAWLMALAGVLLLRWHYSRKIDRLEESSSEEMIEELEQAYAPAPQVRIRTQTEYLPYVIETIRENVDSGLAEQQVRMLLERIENHRPDRESHAVFPVECGRSTSDLRLSWRCDANSRIELVIQGDPRIIRELRKTKRRIPKAAICGQAGRS